MDSQDLRNLQEAYSNVYEQQIGVPLKSASDRAAKEQLKKMIPKGEKIYTPKATLQNAAYEPEGEEIEEDIRNRDVSARGGFDPRFDKRPTTTGSGQVRTPGGPVKTPGGPVSTPRPTGPVAQAPKPAGGILGTLDKAARDVAGRVGGEIGAQQGRQKYGNVLGIPERIGRNRGTQQGQQMYDKAKETVGGLLKQDYDYEIDEMAMNPNSRFTTASQRKEYSANQIGSKEFSNRGGYAGLKAGGGQAALKKGSSVSDVLYAGQKAKQAKAQQDFSNKINRPAKQQSAPKKPMDDFAAGGGAAKMKATGMSKDQVIAQGKKNLANSYEPDLFDVILEYLVAEGYADTNDNALVIMANMSEEWRQTILEAEVLAMKGGVPGSVKVRPSISIPGTNIGVGPNKPVPGTFTTTTPGQREKIKQGDTHIDRGVGGMQPRQGAGPTGEERRRYNSQVARSRTPGKPMPQ